jgi:hypothetical protein
MKWVRRHRRKHVCMCGCGEIIEIKPEHYSRGVPKYIKGHNFNGVHNPRTEDDPDIQKRSSTWEVLSEEEKQRRLNNLKNFGKMENHPGWKGGRVRDEHGYIRIRMPEHPFSNEGYILEHRLVMENFLREKYPGSPYLHMYKKILYLKPEVVVHHVDEVKGNNDINNLFPFPDNAAHIFWHSSSLPDKDKIKRIKSGLYKTYIREELLNTDDGKNKNN